MNSWTIGTVPAGSLSSRSAILEQIFAAISAALAS
jgi:hypothetical protein